MISKMSVENPTIQEIADYTGTSRQNTKRMLEQLAKKEFVKVSKSENDARALNVKLSGRTWEYFSANEKMANESLSKLFARILDKELSVTIKLFDKLLTALGIAPLEGIT